MNVEDIMKINRTLEKMIRETDVNESLAEDLLSRLHESHITLHILKETNIGKTVNLLRKKITNKKLISTSKDLLKNWRKLIPECNTLTNDGKHKTNLLKEIKVHFLEESITKKHSSSKSSGSDLVNAPRSKSLDLLIGALTIASPPDGAADPVSLAARVEKAVFEELKNTGPKYCNRIRSRVLNLKDSKNPRLRNDVLLGILSPERLAILTAEEMASDEMKAQRSKLVDLSLSECQLAVDDSIGTDLIRCNRCKQNNCAYTEVQTLSADEPMTLFVLCKNCGYRWKM